MSNIIFLNGTSSSGKTTLSKEIQQLSEVRYFHMSIDSFCNMLAPKFMEQDLMNSANIAASAMHKTALSLCSAGENVIIDNVIEDLFIHWLKECIFLFKGFNVTFVNVFCDKDDLIKREHKRGDREIGQAVAQLEHMSLVNEYDLRVNTSIMSSSDCASYILENLTKNTVDSAFQVLQEKWEIDESFRVEHHITKHCHHVQN